MITCECGVSYEIGDWPFCPHGTGAAVPFRDDIPGGVVVENYGKDPIRFDSHSERRRYMAAHGLIEKEKFCPTPGTDVDPTGVQNPKGYVDEYTMRNGIELLMRAQGTPDETPLAFARVFRGELTEKDVAAIGESDVRRQARLGQRLKRGA